MGHENVGIVAKAGAKWPKIHGLREGDRIFVEHYVGCMHCEWCRLGEYRHCELTDWRTNPDARRYGYTSSNNPGRLWGGFSQYMYLPWNAVTHKVPGRRLRRAGRPGHAAVQRHRVGAQRRQGRLRLHRAHPGPGPAGPVAGRRLQAGRRLADRRHRHHPGRHPAAAGARTSAPTPSSTSSRRTRSSGSWSSPAARASTSSSTAPPGAGTAPVLLGIDALKRREGIMVTQGEEAAFPDFPLKKMTEKCITLASARGHSYRSVELALEQLASGRFPLERLATHRFGLEDVDHAIRTLAGETGEDAIHISLLPWGEDARERGPGQRRRHRHRAGRPGGRRRAGRARRLDRPRGAGPHPPARPGAAARSTPARASPGPRSRSACRPATTG